MDPSFFGLDGHPFDSSYDRDEACLTDTHASLISELRAGLKAPHGITLLIGEEGTGKTRLIRRFADELADDCKVAYLPTTGPGLRHLLTEIIEQLGGSPPAAAEESSLLEALSGLARARAEHGRSTLVVIDEAHELPAKTIERIGRLFGDDPADPSMLHVVLVGRSELLDRMNAANDRSILKHLVQVCRMDPIGPEESFRYIADRIARVGGEVDQLFTQDALRLIVKRANGNPGRIDAICSAALRQAAECGERAIGAETVDLACMGVEGFRADGSPANTDGGDPMQYVFGDEEEQHGGANVQRRLRGHTDDSNDSADAKPKATEGSAVSAGLAGRIARIRAGFAIDGGRRQLLVWGVGLIAVLIGFVSVTSRTGEKAAEVPEAETKLAAAGREGGDETAREAAKPGQQGPAEVPSNAVKSSHLVVKRDGQPPAAETAPPTPPASPEAAAAKPAVPDDPASKAGAEAGARVPAPAVIPAPPSADAPGAVPGVAAAPGRGTSAPESPPSARPPSAAHPAGAPVGQPPALSAATAAPDTAPKAPAGGGATAPAVTAPTAAAPAATPPAVTPPAAIAAKPQVVTPPAPAAVASAKETKPAPAAIKPAPKQVASAQPVSGGKYTVQLGAFKSRENAEALLARALKAYPDGRVLGPDAGVFRVVSGAFATKADAEARARTLGAKGFTAYVRAIPR